MHACKPKQKDVSLAFFRITSVLSVGFGSDDGSFGAQAAKLRSPKQEVRQASTCKSPQAAERKWRRLVLAVTGMHSSWSYCGLMATLQDDRSLFSPKFHPDKCMGADLTTRH